jgi:AraC-like DNA-binding protein/mannose-6-phosphate isomerase-like protein (cupin superfamily)
MTDTNISWRHQRRIELTRDEIVMPDVAYFGRYNYSHAAPALPIHAHQQCMEFCFLLRGRQTYRVGKRTHKLTGGDIFVTFPDEPHDTAGTPEEKGVLYWVIIRIPPANEEFLGLNHTQGAALRTALLNLPARQFRAPKDIALHLDTLMQEHFNPPSPLRAVRFQNLLVALLLEVVQAAAQRNRRPSRGHATLNRLKAMIESSLSNPVSISTLAETAGLSVPRFKVWFREQTGVPPGEYILRRRVEEACRLLTDTKTRITDLGYTMGFSSSQYFATVIKRYTGLTPKQVRQLEKPPVAKIAAC